MENNMKIILKTEEKPEVDKIAEMLKNLNDSEKGKMLIFMQGVKFAKETVLATEWEAQAWQKE